MVTSILALAVLSSPATDPWEGRYEIVDKRIWQAAIRLSADGAKYKARGFWGSKYSSTKIVGIFDPLGNQFVGKTIFPEGGANRLTGYWSKKEKRLVLTSDSGDALVTIELARAGRR